LLSTTLAPSSYTPSWSLSSRRRRSWTLEAVRVTTAGARGAYILSRTRASGCSGKKAHAGMLLQPKLALTGNASTTAQLAGSRRLLGRVATSYDDAEGLVTTCRTTELLCLGEIVYLSCSLQGLTCDRHQQVTGPQCCVWFVWAGFRKGSL
jgi:hypothetical protein